VLLRIGASKKSAAARDLAPLTGESEGFMKILVDADTKEILGASFLGTSGDEAIHCVLDAMYAKAPYTVLQRAVHIHPTVAEFIPTILGELAPFPEVVST
jgi:pyruvate/2-oxoglutarate dehydrogenase complex dihydrolipoamide dehydrogenase (E3) component